VNERGKGNEKEDSPVSRLQERKPGEQRQREDSKGVNILESDEQEE